MINELENKVKSEKGITLITLIVAVLILALITAALATNSFDSLQLGKLTKLENDIEALNNRIAAYYVEHEELPTLGNPYTKIDLKSEMADLSANDGDEYYTIDLSKLENLTLNYGKDYLNFSENSYIINTESHIIYYLKGINYKGIVYHTVGKNSKVTLDY